jgi:hypothetical protein
MRLLPNIDCCSYSSFSWKKQPQDEEEEEEEV